MAPSGDAFRKQHDIDKLNDPKLGDKITPDDDADNDIEGITDIDELHRKAFGDEEEDLTISEKINKDGIDRLKETEDEDSES